MEKLISIDYNDPQWNEVTYNIKSGWGNMENETRLAFKTTNLEITEEQITDYIDKKFECELQQLDCENMNSEVEKPEKDCNYFAVSFFIYDL